MHYLTNPLREVLLLSFFEEWGYWMTEIKLLIFVSRCVWCQRPSLPQLNSFPEQMKKKIRMILPPALLNFYLLGSLLLANIIAWFKKGSYLINFCISNNAWHIKMLTPCVVNGMGSGRLGMMLKKEDSCCLCRCQQRRVSQCYRFSRGIAVQCLQSKSSFNHNSPPPYLQLPGNVFCKASICI